MFSGGVGEVEAEELGSVATGSEHLQGDEGLGWLHEEQDYAMQAL